MKEEFVHYRTSRRRFNASPREQYSKHELRIGTFTLRDDVTRRLRAYNKVFELVAPSPLVYNMCMYITQLSNFRRTNP